MSAPDWPDVELEVRRDVRIDEDERGRASLADATDRTTLVIARTNAPDGREAAAWGAIWPGTPAGGDDDAKTRLEPVLRDKLARLIDTAASA